MFFLFVRHTLVDNLGILVDKFQFHFHYIYLFAAVVEVKYSFLVLYMEANTLL
jgi:hypothetical protein